MYRLLHQWAPSLQQGLTLPVRSVQGVLWPLSSQPFGTQLVNREHAQLSPDEFLGLQVYMAACHNSVYKAIGAAVPFPCILDHYAWDWEMKADDEPQHSPLFI